MLGVQAGTKGEEGPIVASPVPVGFVQNLCQWLADRPSSAALRGSTWLYPIVESVHVLTLCLFAGFAALLDLRLLGKIMRQTPVSEIARNTEYWLKGGFAVMVVSGTLLFYSKPVDFYNNVFFRAKLVMLVLAGLNVLVFHLTVYRTVDKWELAEVPPSNARFAGAASLILWTGVIIAGRMIAYNWFK